MQNIPVNCAAFEKIYIFYVWMRAYEIYKRLFDLLIRYGYLIYQMENVTFFIYIYARCAKRIIIFSTKTEFFTLSKFQSMQKSLEWMN